MKVFLYILGAIGGILALAFAAFVWIASGANLPSIPPAKTPPPDGFDASLYRDIAELQSVDGVKVQNLAQYGEFFESIFRPDEGFLWIMLFDGKDGLVYLTVAPDGRVTGVQPYKDRPRVMGTTLLSADGYREMGPQGFSDMRPYVAVEQALSEAEIVALNRESRLAHTRSWTDAPRDSRIFKERILQHIVLHDGVWKTFETQLKPQLQYKGENFSAELAAQYHHSGDRASNDPSFPRDRFDLRLVYFDQQEYFGKRNAPMGSTTGIGRAAHWRGTGYYTVTVDGQDLRFRIENDRLNNGFGGFITLIAESHADVGYMLLTNRYRSEKQHAYLISPAD